MDGMGAVRARLGGGRWHWQHGPIDIVAQAEGEPAAVAAAHEAAWSRFQTVLAELVAELPLLRTAVGPPCPLQGPVAQVMWNACAPYAAGFITPMAAVAGAVADALVPCYHRPGITRAWLNNGGDIALHLAPGASARVGMMTDLSRLDRAALASGLRLDGRFELSHPCPVRGVATSGWRGRSHSLGVADSVTVLASTAAMADAAATVVANAVDLPGDPRVQRRPANALRDDTDLGDRLVTVDVARLPADAAAQALDAGAATAMRLQRRGLIHAAVLVCQGHHRVLDAAAALSHGPVGQDTVGSVSAS